MLITGHKSTSMFRRYNITDERDLKEAMRKAQAYVQTLPTDGRPVSEGGRQRDPVGQCDTCVIVRVAKWVETGPE